VQKVTKVFLQTGGSSYNLESPDEDAEPARNEVGLSGCVRVILYSDSLADSTS